VGAWSGTTLFADRLPYAVILGLQAAAPAVPGWPAGASSQHIRDYFVPEFPSGVAERAEGARPCAADPFCVGVFTDNEMPWGPSAIQVGTHVDAYMTLPPGAPGKLALQAFFEERYGRDIAAFNAAWGQQLTTFADLQDTDTLGEAGDPQCEPAARIADRRAFTATVATRYYEGAHDALRAIDPALLILGSRFLSTFTAPEVVPRRPGSTSSR
jgi:hypothetical protein